MSFAAGVTAAVVLLAAALLVRGRYPTDGVLAAAVFALIVTRVLTPEQALSGFANPALVTIAFLYIVAQGLKDTGGLELLVGKLLRNPRSKLTAQLGVTLPVAFLSAFASNTAIVASYTPLVQSTCRRSGISPSLLFMPLSFAAILGGLCTLIGTSTNLVVSGLLLEHGGGGFEMLTMAPAGIAMALVGIAYIALFGRMLLPSARGPATTSESVREYMTGLRVTSSSDLVGASIEAAGLRHMPGVFLSRIERDGEVETAVGPEQIIRADDVLVFVGALDSVLGLRQDHALEPVDALAVREGTGAYAEVVVSRNSPLVGRSIRDATVRTRYGAVVLAVHRHGERIEGRIGDIVVQPGDALLLETTRAFWARYRDSHDFVLVSDPKQEGGERPSRGPLALLVTVAMIVVMALRLADPVVAAMGAAALMLVLRCCSVARARSAVNWQVLVIIGSALALGRAMEVSGLARDIAGAVLPAGSGLGLAALLAIVYALTSVFTAFMSNAAAAAVVFPIAMQAASAAGLPELPFAICVALAASAEFSTPIGYHTNLMVQAAGRYRWLDYTRFGGPLTVLCGATCVGVLSWMY